MHAPLGKTQLFLVALSLSLAAIGLIALIMQTAASSSVADKWPPDPTHSANTVWGGRKHSMYWYKWAPYLSDGRVELGYVAVNTEDGLKTMHSVKCWSRHLGRDAEAPTYFWVPEAMIKGVLRKFSEWGKVSESQTYEMRVEKPFAGYETYPATFNHEKVSFLKRTYITFDSLPRGCGIEYISKAYAEYKSGTRRMIGTSEQVQDVEEKIKAAKRQALKLARPPDPFN